MNINFSTGVFTNGQVDWVKTAILNSTAKTSFEKTLDKEKERNRKVEEILSGNRTKNDRYK